MWQAREQQPFHEKQPQPVGYNPQPVGYNPQPVGYNPQPVGYNPQPVGYNPQPVGYNPQYGTKPSGHTPQPVQAQPHGAQPPGAGFSGTYPAGHTVVMAGVGAGFTRDPSQMKCSQCGTDIITDIKYVNGQGVCCCVLLLLLLGCCCGCCLMPLCNNKYKDAEHHCPNCKAHLGTCPAPAVFVQGES